MEFINRLIAGVFKSSRSPASSDGDDTAWEQAEHNKELRRRLPTAKADVIRTADKRSQERYGAMDAHIKRLKEMAAESRRRKIHLRALRETKHNN